MDAPFKLSQAAQKHIASLLALESPDVFFRMQVSAGGCRGLQCEFHLDVMDPAWDYAYHFQDARILVDAISAPYFQDAVIDFRCDDQGMMETFHVQMSQLKQCSCGRSFDIKGEV